MNWKGYSILAAALFISVYLHRNSGRLTGTLLLSILIGAAIIFAVVVFIGQPLVLHIINKYIKWPKIRSFLVADKKCEEVFVKFESGGILVFAISFQDNKVYDFYRYADIDRLYEIIDNPQKLLHNFEINFSEIHDVIVEKSFDKLYILKLIYSHNNEAEQKYTRWEFRKKMKSEVYEIASRLRHKIIA